MSAEAVLGLLRLEHLRAIGFHRVRQESLSSAWREVVRELPIERFDDLVEVPEPAMWSVLQEKPRLRSLYLGAQGGASIQGVIVAASRCAHLEVVALSHPKLPTHDDLASLRHHPSLRTLRLQVDPPTATPPTAAELADLQRDLPAHIEFLR